jgi:hypothetical protein
MAEPDRSDATQIFESPEGPPPPSSPPAMPSRAPLAAEAQPSPPPREAFAPPLSIQRHGTRRTLPTLIVAAVVIADAAALIVYFSAIK